MQTLIITLSVYVCIDENCDRTPILSDNVVPMPFCNENGTLSLPGDGTIDGFLRHISGRYNGTIIDTVLSSLGIKVRSNINWGIMRCDTTLQTFVMSEQRRYCDF